MDLSIVLMYFQMGFTDNEGKPGNFAEQYNSRRELHLSSLQQKEEEMRQKFVIRVKEKEAELKEAEKEVTIFYANPKTILLRRFDRPDVRHILYQFINLNYFSVTRKV